MASPQAPAPGCCAATLSRKGRGLKARGLAMLELVLALPLLLFVTALMLNFGAVAVWKVRALGVAKHATWSHRQPYSGVNNPNNDYWPGSRPGAGEVAGATNLDDPQADLPVARGPQLQLIGWGSTLADVNRDLLNPARGQTVDNPGAHFFQAQAGKSQPFPMLRGMGSFNVNARDLTLDGVWPWWHSMRWPNNGGDPNDNAMLSNYDRRMQVLYRMAQPPQNLADAYLQAALAVYYGFYAPLGPIRTIEGNDVDAQRYNVMYTAIAQTMNKPLRIPGSFVHVNPLASNQPFCSLDHAYVRTLVDLTVQNIQGDSALGIRGMPQRLGRAFRTMFDDVDNLLQAMQQAGMVIDPAELSYAQQNRDDIDAALPNLP